MKFSEPEGLDQPQHTIRGEASKKELCSKRKDREIDREEDIFPRGREEARVFENFFLFFIFNFASRYIYLLSILLIRSYLSIVRDDLESS